MSHDSTDAGPLPLGQPFGRYIPEEKIGGGGFGTVYRAKDTLYDREVALKVPHAETMRDPRVRELFLQEARAAAKLDDLNNPHICRVLDADAVGGRPYLVMQLIAGTPLRRYRPDGTDYMDAGRAAGLVYTVARAMAAVHGQGMIHRDLKPDNVLIVPGQPEPLPVIIDFGLALALNRADAAFPRPNEFAGTLWYMAPEVFSPEETPVGPASDVWSLGVILYELLTGRLPFDGDDLWTLHAQITGAEPPAPSLVRPGVPAALDAVCRKALAKEVPARFVSMDVMADALSDYFTGGGDEAAAPAGAAPLRPAVPRSAVRFAFVGYGSQAPPAAALRDRLFLDVGNDLRPGVIDHHHLVAYSGSTARLVLNRPDLLDASVWAGRRPGDPFTVVLHQSPDLDSAVSAYLAIAYLGERRFPEQSDWLAFYADEVDEGVRGMSRANPFDLYGAYHRLANRPAPPEAAREEKWTRAVEDGLLLIDYVLAQARNTGRSLEEVDAFACPGLLGDDDRRAVTDDMERYQRKMADPLCAARAVTLRLPGRFGGSVQTPALLARDVQNEDDPGRVLFFKDWARSDAGRCPDTGGFVALSVYMSRSASQRRSCILSVRADSRASLRGLGAELEKAESAKRRKLHGGTDDREVDPLTLEAKPPRPGYANSDPWYDGRAHGYTIVDAPRSGTELTAGEIEEVFLRFGGAAP
jgi:tRNA A-37 threonylcarbamoyl transferase component Bud32